MDVIKAEKLVYSGAIAPGHCSTLNSVSFTVGKAQLVCVLGASGAGKTCLLHALHGLLPIDGGKLYISGHDCGSGDDHWGIRKICSLVLERAEDRYLSTSVQDELAFAYRNFAQDDTATQAHISEALSFVGLQGFENCSLPLLSAGDRYRVAIAAALVYGPETVLIDAAAEGFDAPEQEKIFGIIKNIHRSGKTVVYTSRNSQDAVMADKVIVLKEGSVLASGSPREILTDAELLSEALLELPFTVRVYYDLLEAGAKLSSCPLDIDELVEEVCR